MSYHGSQCMSCHGSLCASYYGSQCISYNGSQRMSFLGSQCMRYHHRLPLPRSGRLPRPITPLPHPEHGEGGEAEMQLADVLLDAGAPRRPRHQPQVQRHEAAADARARFFARWRSSRDARGLVRARVRRREPARTWERFCKRVRTRVCVCFVRPECVSARAFLRVCVRARARVCARVFRARA